MTTSRIRRAARGSGGALAIAALAVLVTASAQAAGPGSGSRHTLPGTRPGWAARATAAPAPASTQSVNARVWLAPRNSAQLDALAQAVSDPSSAQYGQYLTDDQYQAQFAPTQAQVDQVTQWLTQAGLSVVSVGPDNHYISTSGSVADVNAALDTQLASYVVKGQTTLAPTTDISVPDSLSDVVLAVTGITTFGHKTAPADFGAPDAFVNATPCSSYYGQQQATNLPKFQGRTLPYAVCGYTPTQLRSAYGISGGPGFGQAPGRGQTVAIVDAYDAPTLERDADVFSLRHGDQPFGRGQFQDLSVPENAAKGEDPNNPDGQCGGNGWYGEQALDVEAVHGMAPGANVLYYGAATCFDDDLLAALTQVVHDNKASIVTNSWGEPTFYLDPVAGVTQIEDPATIAAYESVFKQGAVQGIGFYFSSGDDGDELANTGVAAPDYPTSDPWVTSVGGTSLAIGQNGNRLFETGWGTAKYTPASNDHHWSQVTPFLYGAGGGVSTLFPEPWYQQGVVPRRTTGRANPDIAMDADPTTGLLVGETQNFSDASVFGPAGVHYGEYRIGGTSLASPLMAGVQADAQAVAGRRTGFANPLIYSLARSLSSVFYDVTPQGDLGNIRSDFANGLNASGGLLSSLRTFDQDSSLTTGPGWDDVTGVGSITGRYLTSLPTLRH